MVVKASIFTSPLSNNNCKTDYTTANTSPFSRPQVAVIRNPIPRLGIVTIHPEKSIGAAGISIFTLGWSRKYKPGFFKLRALP
jgi:hypothetical protein